MKKGQFRIKRLRHLYYCHHLTRYSLKNLKKGIKITLCNIYNLIERDKMTSLHVQKGAVSLVLNDNSMPHYFDKNNKKI